jgi:hypothetical protein
VAENAAKIIKQARIARGEISSRKKMAAAAKMSHRIGVAAGAINENHNVAASAAISE